MNKEEIKHFKAMLRQGSLRHMNILLDDKFQKELLNIIKDYEKLQQENKELMRINEGVHKAREKDTETINELAMVLVNLREWLVEQEQRSWDEVSSTFGYVLDKLDELEGKYE